MAPKKPKLPWSLKEKDKLVDFHVGTEYEELTFQEINLKKKEERGIYVIKREICKS